MFPELSSEVTQIRHFQPSHGKYGRTIGRGQIGDSAKETLQKLTSKLREQDLPGIEFAEKYLLHLYRRNRRPNTLELNYTSIRFFLKFLETEGVTHLEGVSRKHLEAFIEHEQDRGLKPISVRGRLASVKAFLRHLIEEGTVRHEALSRGVSVKVPDALPRAMAPEDVRQLLSVVDNVRNRAMVLMLLRTGMRIGELLALRVEDIDLGEQKVLIYEARKTGTGRVVYFSSDAKDALVAWLEQKDPREDVLAYGKKYESITYSAARAMFVGYLKKAGLLHKGYSLHCLRHTFASELLNAGMRLECLQPLLGHTSLEVTRRYARLTDKTREEEYFKAMALIEKGAVHGNYRFDHRL
jgi:integrase/recombinase XerD